MLFRNVRLVVWEWRPSSKVNVAAPGCPFQGTVVMGPATESENTQPTPIAKEDIFFMVHL
jgi:hypothetical protein